MKRPILVIILAALSLVAAQAQTGAIRQEFYQDKVRADVENGTTGPPTSVANLDSFHVPVNQGDSYAERVSGYFIPATTGNYVFFVCSDDDSDLFLSTDDSPSNKKLIASETGWSNDQEWTISSGGSSLSQKRSDKFLPAGSSTAPNAAGIALKAGQRYYIEGAHHEGGGGDDFSATFKLVSDPDPTNGSPSKLTGPVIAAATGPLIVSQPANRRAAAGGTVTLSAAVSVPDATSTTYQWYKGTTAISGATDTIYTTPALTAADDQSVYSLKVMNGATTLVSSNAVITIGKLVQVAGAKEELWNGATKDDVESGAQDNVPPDVLRALLTFEVPVNQADTFSERVSAIFVPPVTGAYVFFVCSDDNSDLFLSTDDTPAHKTQIAAETGWSNNQEWIASSGGSSLTQKRSDKWVPDPTNPPASPPFANGIQLVAGTKYYIEGVHNEGGGGDDFSATFKLVGDPDPATGTPTRIISAMMAPWVSTLNGAQIKINTDLSAITGTQSRTTTATISATASYIGDTSSAAPALAYQWQAAPKGSSTFTNIQGANAASYTTPLLNLADAGTQYRVQIAAADTNAVTSVGTLSVTPDTTPPQAAQVTSVNAAGTSVTFSFNELMDKASAETAANYSFGSVKATAASLASNGTDVTLTTSALTPNTALTLTINGVKDLAGNAANNATIQFKFQPVTYQDDILFDGPLAYFRFEETSGTVAKNSGSSGVDGAYYSGDEATAGEGGTPVPAKGDAGPRPPDFAGFPADNHSVAFTGPNAGSEWVDAKSQYLQDKAAFTLEYWVNPSGGRTNSPSDWLTRVGLVGQNDAIEYGFIDPATIQIWTPNGGSLNTTYTFGDDQWHHVATIADGTNLKNYFDGVLVGTGGGATADYGASTYNVHIGGGGVFDATGNYFTGHMDEVAIFDKAIPAARVAEHFKAGKSGGVIVTNLGTGGGGGNGAQLTLTHSGGNLTIAWAPTGGTLQSATALTGKPSDWTDAGTTNPATVTIGKTGNAFYRVKQ